MRSLRRAHDLWRYPWAVVVAPAIIFAKGLVGLALYAPGDGGQLFLPWFLVSAREWLSGHLPTWNPFAQAGSPLLGSSQAGVLYPPNLVFLAFGPVVANNLGIALSVVIAGLGAWFLARQLTGDNLGAAVGGLGFGLSAFFFAQIPHQSIIATAAYLPWMLFGYELVRQRWTAPRFLVPSAAIALAALAGHSQLFFMDLLLAAVYVALAELQGRGRAPVRGAAIAAGALAAGLALGAVQLLPTILVAGKGLRQAVSYRFAMSYSLPWTQLPMLAFPYLFGKPWAGGAYAATFGGAWNITELSGYPGAAVLTLAVAGLMAVRTDRRSRAVLGLGVVALLLALGPATELTHLVYRLPVYGQFRSWGRYLFGFDLSVALLAAYGVRMIRRGSTSQRRMALILAAATAATLGALALGLPHLGAIRRLIPTGTPRPAALAVPVGFAVAGVLAAAALRRFRRAAALVLVVIVAADAFFAFGGFADWREHSPSPARYTAAIKPGTPLGWGPVSPAPGGIARYLFMGANLGALGDDFVELTDARDERSVNANDVLMNRDFAGTLGMTEAGQDYLDFELWQPTSHVMDLLRITTVIIQPSATGGSPPPDSLLTAGQPVGDGLVRYTYAPRLPEAFLAGTTTQVTLAAARQAIYGGSPEPFDPLTTALVDTPCASCPVGPTATVGEATGVHWGPNSVQLTVHAIQPAVLVLSQAWSPGWVADVGGRTVPVIRVDGLVQGVPVPAGTRLIRLRYRAPGLRAGFGITVVAVLVLGALVVTERSRARRRQARRGSRSR